MRASACEWHVCAQCPTSGSFAAVQKWPQVKKSVRWLQVESVTDLKKWRLSNVDQDQTRSRHRARVEHVFGSTGRPASHGDPGSRFGRRAELDGSRLDRWTCRWRYQRVTGKHRGRLSDTGST